MSFTSIETPKSLSSRYTFIRVIGEGTQGTTYLARQEKDQKEVAIKGIRFSKLANLKSYELFQREAEVLKRLEVDGVPKFYDSLFDEDGDCWIVQEYIHAPSLLEHLNSHGRLSELKTLKVMSKVADILNVLETEYAPPVIHRDIKPANILCKLEDEDPKVWLIDFGAVANPLNHSGGSTIAGTFGYMALEQFVGNVAIQSDFYALGATALHMITGISPADMPVVGFKLDFLTVLERYAPDATPQMRALIGHLLATEIASRPASALHLKSEIEAVITGIPNKMPERIDSLKTSTVQKVGFWQRLIHKITGNNDSLTHQTSPKEEWKRTIGEVRSINASGELEYTFEINGRLWAGRYPALPKEKTRKLPWCCEIYFNADDPSRNRVLSENEINALNEGNYSEKANLRDADGRTPLMKARTLKDVYKLIKEGADLNEKDNELKPVLLYFVDNPEIFQTLIEYGADPNIKCLNEEISLLLLEQVYKKPEIVQMLIEAGINLDEKDKELKPIILNFVDNPEIFQMLLKAGANPNIKCFDEEIPLLALEQICKRPELFQMVIEAGADVNAKDKIGNPILFYHTVLSRPSHVKMLIDAGLEINIKNKDGNPIWSISTALSHIETMKMLVNAGLEINTTDIDGYPLVLYPTVLQNAELMKLLIDAGADINIKTPYGNPILLSNTAINHPDVYQLLIDAHADVNAKDKNNIPIIFNDAIIKNPEIMEMLIKAGANLNIKDKEGYPLLFYRELINHIDVLKKVLQSNININARNPNGNPILGISEVIHHTEAFQLLVKAGANVNAKMSDGNPIFTLEEIQKNAELVKILIDAGADVNAKDKDDWPLLCYLPIIKQPEVFQMLIDAGADVNVRLPNGWPLLGYAQIANRPELFKKLLDAGADPNAKHTNGNPIIMNEEILKNIETVKLLIAAGADVNALDQSGNSLLLQPKVISNPELFDILVDAGANIRVLESIAIFSTSLDNPQIIKSLMKKSKNKIHGNKYINSITHKINNWFKDDDDDDE